jgi:hypothetical protein
MRKSTRNIPKKRGRGRPSTGGRKPGVFVSLDAQQFRKIDEWIAQQADSTLKRPEAIRRLIEQALARCIKP